MAQESVLSHQHRQEYLMSEPRGCLESEHCTNGFLDALRVPPVGRLVRNNTIMMIEFKDGNWEVQFSSFLPSFDLNELKDVVTIEMHRRYWIQNVTFKSDEGLRSCVRALDRMCALPESC
jgi:hypothetical protein